MRGGTSLLCRRAARVAVVCVAAGAMGHAAVGQQSAGSRTQQVSGRSAARSQMPSPYRITGVVVNRVSGSPVAHCHLAASRTGRTGRSGFAGGQVMGMVGRPGGFGPQMASFGGRGTETDADEQGRFSLTVPEAGAWRLTASAPGFGTEAYDEHEGYSSAVVLTEAAPAMELRFTLSPQASVSGTVLDEAGEAVRMAQVMLYRVPLPSPDARQAMVTVRGQTQTDDRGLYEFDNLAAGNYRIAVNARPWYASGNQGTRGNPLDPSLDVTYAETWYPGTEDAAGAETLTLKAGDSVDADLSLRPVASIHLQIVTPPPVANAEGERGGMMVPMVERVGATGFGFMPQFVNRMQQNGQWDIGGLAPGTYQVRLQGPGTEPKTALVEVTEGGTHVVDFNAPSDQARVTFQFDGAVSDDSGVEVMLINTASGARMSAGGGMMHESRDTSRVLEVPPGEYEVVLAGRDNLYLDSMTAKNAEAKGRILKLHGGDAVVTAHVREGRAAVTGFVHGNGKPLEGAMVLLVPAGLEDPGALTHLARDQSNTDGSFEMPAVIPGQYILVAIDEGWQVNWKDASTLNRYLMQGVPLDLRPATKVKQDVEAQSP